MNIIIGSAFRNSSMAAPRYFERVAALQALRSQDRISVVAVEGDSTDNTREALVLSARYHKIPIDLRTCNHGGPVYGSTEQPERMVALSKVGNEIFNGVQRDDDCLVYIESDLMWCPKTISALIDDAMSERGGFDVFAPMVMAGKAFYDIWGFRGPDGVRWTPFWPMHTDLIGLDKQEGYVEMSSVGSCLVMRAVVAETCRIKNDYCLVGWCEDARSKGFRIAARLDLKVRQI